MSSTKLAAVICTSALLAFIAAAVMFGWWPAMTHSTPTAVVTSSQTDVSSSSGNEERLQRAMTFTAPAEPAR